MSHKSQLNSGKECREHQPPRWVEKLLGRIAAPHIQEEILGDLHELFLVRGQRYGYFFARIIYIIDALLLLHPRLWRRLPESIQHFPAFYSKPNPAAMLQNHFKIAFRKLSRHKSYTLINTVSLSLGIACAILIFTLVKYHLSFDNFHADRDRIYRIYTELHGEKVIYNTGVPNPFGEALRSGYSVAEKVGRIAFMSKRVVWLSPEKKFEEDIAFADPAFFSIFNFPLTEGNPQAALKDKNTVLITQSIAQKYFGNADPVGKIIHIDQSLLVRVVGVLRDLPPNSDFRSQIFLPYPNLEDHSPWMVEKDWWMSVNKEMQCYVRLKPGITAESVAKTTLPAISSTHYDKEMAQYFRFKMQPLSDVHFNTDLRGKADKKNLRTFAVIGFLLVVTACVNFVNLATAQAVGRSKEIGVRKALGSERGMLFWQFITETAVIAGFAMLAALGLAYMLLPFVNQWFEIKLSINLFQDYYLLAFLGGLLFFTILLSGVYPGLILARFQPLVALKGKLPQQSVGGVSLRKGLVVAQFAISQLLIIGTLVITNQLRYSQQANMGFGKDAIVILPVPDNTKAKVSTLGSEISQMAGVDAVTFFDTPPASETIGSTGITFDTRPEHEDFSISVKAVDHEYLPTFKIPLVAGRNLNPSDTIREYLLNETTVKALRLASPQEAIGKIATINGFAGTVVGVVKDFHFKSFRAAIEPLALTTKSEIYGSVGIKVKAANLAPILSALEKSWTKMYPSSIYTYRFLDEEIERFYKLDSMLLRLIQAFAGIAIFVGCLGLYGLVSFMAAQKTKEIGVRKVLGASTPSILWLFGKEFVRLLLVAFLLAAPIAWQVMNSWLNSFVYRVEVGAGIFIVAIVVTFVVALVTVGFRSMTAASMNPIKTLRSE